MAKTLSGWKIDLCRGKDQPKTSSGSAPGAIERFQGFEGLKKRTSKEGRFTPAGEEPSCRS